MISSTAQCIRVLGISSAGRVMDLQVPYSTFMHGMQQNNMQVNRKVLADLAANEPLSFKALVDQVKFMKGIS